MCLNFKPSHNTEWIKNKFGVVLPEKINDEVFPDYDCPIIRAAFDPGTSKCDIAHFGLIPYWTKNFKFLPTTNEATKRGKIPVKLMNQTYNAKVETIKQKPSFRTAWSHHHFAVVIVDTFYQYCYQTGFPKKWGIHMPNHEPFALACLWDRWSDVEQGKDILSFAILTTDATNHPLLNQFHKPNDPKRAPVIIPNTLIQEWLTASLDKANEIITLPLPSDLIGEALQDTIQSAAVKTIEKAKMH